MAAKIRIVITETAVNTAANTSTVKAVMQYYGNGTSHNSYSSQCKITMYVNGNKYTGNHTFTASKSWQTLKTVTGITVPHNADGSKTISYSGKYTTGVSIGTLSCSGSTTLTKITRYFTVSYNANGGSGAPGAQTKTYGVNLTLSSVKPVRTGYIFKGWATSSTGGVAYASGGTYTANAAITLYAVWQLAYKAATIDILNASRQSYSTTYVYDEEGTSVLSEFKFTPAKKLVNDVWVNLSNPVVKLTIGTVTHNNVTSPFYTPISEEYSVDIEYKVVLSVTYSDGSIWSSTVTKETFISMSKYTMDINENGTAMGFGRVAPNASGNDWKGLFLHDVNGNKALTNALSAKGLNIKTSSLEEILTYLLTH